MLLRLKISNYALISETEIEFGDGLTVITGETGAGKSILMGALSLVMGSRADVSVIKQGEKKTVVEAEFDVSAYNLRQFFDDNDLDYADRTVIRREILDSGKSRAFVNDTPVNLAALKELGQRLTDIHSQHQTLEIGYESFQTALIDSFAKNGALLASYADIYTQWQHAKSKYDNLVKRAKEIAKEAEYLHFRFDELDKAKLQPDEQRVLEEELEILTHNEDIKMAISNACDELVRAEENTVLQRLKSAISELRKIASYYPKASELADRMESTYIELDDVGREIVDIDENTEYSPERLEFVNERLSTIYGLQKKFNVGSVDELIAIHKDLSEKLSVADNLDEQTAELRKQVETLVSQLRDKATAIGKGRREAVPHLKKEIYGLLESLGIKDSQFDVEFTVTKDYKPNGNDSIKFMFSANKNVPMGELSKTASGGELSRLMLALKYILSRSSKLPTIIFDEIDTGISGDIAGKMGAMFRRMSEHMQVISITHLPQVAAQGNHHLKVFKHEADGAIRSDIKLLDPESRIREIAAMLSGEKITEAALQNARELMAVK
ncbi:MAG: DNA repair protein RecN [Bacteroidales bacterium]|nr:DNA repair protein RecN [Bacteroidales bacterium]